MKAQEIQDMYIGLRNIVSKRVPIKMSFIINRNLKKMEEVVKDIDENRQKLLEKYGEKKEDGTLNIDKNGNVAVEKSNTVNYLMELSEIMNADIDITLDKVTLSDIEKCDTADYDKLSIEEVGALEKMMIEDKPNEQ